MAFVIYDKEKAECRMTFCFFRHFYEALTPVRKGSVDHVCTIFYR